MTTPKLYTRVSINRDIPSQGVHRGDTGLYIEFLEDPRGGEAGAIVEMTIAGEWKLATVPISALSPIPESEEHHPYTAR